MSVRDLLKGYWLILAGSTSNPLARRGRILLRGGVRAYDDRDAQATVIEIPGGGLADAQGSGFTSGATASEILAFSVPENGRARVQIDVYAYAAAFNNAAARLITSSHWTVERNGAGTVAVSGQDLISSDGTLAPTIAVNGVGGQLVVTATGVVGEDISYAARLRVLVGPSGLTGEAIGGAALAPVFVPGPTGPTGPAGAGFTVAATQAADFNAAVSTHYPVNVAGGNVIATLPPLTSVDPGDQISFAVINGGNDLVLAAALTENVRRGVDFGGAVNVSPSGSVYSVLLIADPDNNEWTAQAEA